ncbi:1-phosphofructokinase family hexose kinase [Priestia endophytica]
MIHIVCLNPALDRTIFVKRFQKNGVSRASSSFNALGGKGFNVVRPFLATQETDEVQIHTLLGGPVGLQLQNMMSELGLTINGKVTPIQGYTRYCSVIVEEESGEASLINEKGPEVTTQEMFAFLETLTSSIQNGDYVILSGSLPAGIPVDFYKTIIEETQDLGAKVILDSSGEALSEGVKAKPWLTKVNEHEFLELMNESNSNKSIETIERILTSNDAQSNFIITLGKEGCLAKLNNHVWRFSLPSIQAVNATASGDIFLGGFIKEWSKSRDLEKALIQASTYSLSNCLYWYPKVDVTKANDYRNKIRVYQLS